MHDGNEHHIQITIEKKINILRKYIWNYLQICSSMGKFELTYAVELQVFPFKVQTQK